LSQSVSGAKVEGMRPPLIVMIPWVLSLLLEFWLVSLLVRRKLFKELPVFSAVVVIYAFLDVIAFSATLTHFYAYAMFSLREIANAVLRTWLLITLCRQLLRQHAWTRWLMVVSLVAAATLLVGISFPVFLDEHTSGLTATYLHLGVWFRTAYFTQVGVIAVLLLMNFDSILSTFTREMGIAMGLATMSAAELVSMTLRGRPGGAQDYSLISLNYVGMVTAFAIWIMFLSPRKEAAEHISKREETAEVACMPSSD
jgi:hypothetical protein